MADETATAPTDQTAWSEIRARLSEALLRMDAMVWLGCRRGDREQDEPIGTTALAGRLADAALRTSWQPNCSACGHLGCDGGQPCRALVSWERCRCLGPTELRRMADETATETPDDTLHACPGRWGGPGCRCFDDQPAAGARQDGAET